MLFVLSLFVDCLPASHSGLDVHHIYLVMTLHWMANAMLRYCEVYFERRETTTRLFFEYSRKKHCCTASKIHTQWSNWSPRSRLISTVSKLTTKIRLGASISYISLGKFAYGVTSYFQNFHILVRPSRCNCAEVILF